MPLAGQKRKRRGHKHPYLSGNYAPIQQTCPLTSCTYTGKIPEELAGGQYVRNGGNPLSNQDLGRDAHWFDGDGMLAGVLFKRSPEDSRIQPEFVTQYILTDLYLASVSNRSLRQPILPSIATLVNPASTLITIILRILRTVFLVILSHLSGSRQTIRKISVANTGIYYHDGRALATCESGPPIRVALPNLETVGWFNGNKVEGEVKDDKNREVGFGGTGPLSFLREFTTGHPKVDPITNEMILYHCTFAPPYVLYSVLPASKEISEKKPGLPKLLNQPVQGVSGGKMMHDFGVSRKHTIIMDLPLTLDPINLMKNRPIVSYDATAPSRFGIFGRRDPSNVHWFETSACCIFHTANAWDSEDENGDTISVNLLACRLTSATLVYSAGNIAAPQPTRGAVEELAKPMSFFDKYDDDFDNGDTTTGGVSFMESCSYDAAPGLECPRLEKTPLIKHGTQPQHPLTPAALPSADSCEEEEQCRLYYYNFQLPKHPTSTSTPQITSQFALSAIPFEFPTLNPTRSMKSARYIYGCSTSSSSFGAALGRSVKIDVLAKIDTQTLLQRAQARPPAPITGCVDTRSVSDVLQSTDPHDPIKAFQMPRGWFAQEARFVPRADPRAEDDGFLLFYAFDEGQLDEQGEAPDTAVSELWIVDALEMRDVLARIRLPQRVPYGLHGEWFTERQIREQRGFEGVRRVEDVLRRVDGGGWAWGVWMRVRRGAERLLNF